jgi:alkylation response protein AidB-like acyl-CoA dehydrogenase
MPVRPCIAGPFTQRPVPTHHEVEAHQLRARAFADEVVRPLGLALDRLPVAETVAPGSPIYEFLDQAVEEGFLSLGPAGRDAEYLALEEIATADAGLGALLVTMHVAGPRGGLWCLHSPARPGHFRLDRDGPAWRLNGCARQPVIGVAAATHALIVCADGARTGHALVVVPLDRPGVGRTVVESQLGLRAAAAGSLVFDGASVEHDELLDHGPRRPRIARTLALDHLAVAVLSVGIARSAYDGAARWARERGEASTRRITVMRALLDRSRCVTRAAYAHLDSTSISATAQAAFARALASQTAIEVARHALWITGAGSLDPDGVEHLDGSRFHPEKLVRDACEHGFMLPRRQAAGHRRTVHPREQRSASWGL